VQTHVGAELCLLHVHDHRRRSIPPCRLGGSGTRCQFLALHPTIHRPGRGLFSATRHRNPILSP
jgi:hypothetical protein